MPSPHLGYTEWTEGQALPASGGNEITRIIELFAAGGPIIDRDLGTPPGSPAQGDAYLVPTGASGVWSTNVGKIALYVNTAWMYIIAKEGMTLWVKDENVRITYDGAAWNAGLDGYTIDTDGTLAANSDTKIASQKATKTYVDNKVAGLSWKQAARCATTAAGTLATDFENGDTVDGVVLATGDRILIKNQAAAAENGFYTVNRSGAPTRAADANSGAELVNASCYVSEGTANADKQFVCTTNAPITLETTGLTFTEFTSGGGYTDEQVRDVIGTALTEGNGIDITVDDGADTITLAVKGATSKSEAGTAYTAVLADANKYILFTAATAVAFTIPPNSSVAFPVDTVIALEQNGAGVVTITPGAGG